MCKLHVFFAAKCEREVPSDFLLLLLTPLKQMSMRQYFKPVDGLPDPQGSPSRAIPSAVIVSANLEVQKVMDSAKKKRSPYKK